LDRAGSALTGHLAEIRALAFSGDGQLLASGDTSGTVRLWNAESETLELEFQRPGHMIESMTFSVDGHFLAVKSDQSLTMYPTTLTELIVEAYRHVGSRRLTNDECARYLQMKACPPAP
jgi:WD40 repeat protein